ncbi:uncharacterized protein LOC131040408 [Cryptomeria japonica]|uniref:uncharacterized protein LOC131040408 n=1 Tax=Cryptomeria japonica TaxID=3369 RepID=UPI0027DA32E1|nr:uncharacterized protein LOC131040408 [Cryptomeria japonica]
MEVNLNISIGPRTGRVYVRDPSMCSKISGVKYQCQQMPAPRSKFCHHHLEMNKRVRNKTTKSQINRKNCDKYKGKGKGKFKRRQSSKQLRYENIQSDEDEDNEDEHEDIEKDEKANSYEKMDGAGNTDAEKKSHSYSSDNHLLKNISQRGRNNKHIEKKLYRKKMLNDYIHQLKLVQECIHDLERKIDECREKNVE